MDLAGGTLDIWPLYLYHPGAVTLNFAVDRWTRAMLQPRADSRIVLRSTDLGRESDYASLDELLRDRRPALPLAAEIARFFLPPTGFELTIPSDVPATRLRLHFALELRTLL